MGRVWVPPTPRWTEMMPHRIQQMLWNSPVRFKVVSAGRRSGKTEIAKRAGCYFAMFTTRIGARIVFAAPTFTQATDIFWADIKKLIPPQMIAHISETRKKITLVQNGATLEILGMDSPERIEGSPVDFLVLDEFANMKAKAWDAHCRPALSTLGRPGFAWLTGVPEGRTHYYDKFMMGNNPDPKYRHWASFTWKSSDILPAYEIADARATMDPKTFRQEFEGSFETASGLLYYTFDRNIHATRKLGYRHDLPIILCFDWGVSPGVAAIVQEQPVDIARFGPTATCVLDEIFIPDDSNTELVCRELLHKIGGCETEVIAYGDPAGGSRSTQATLTDWEIVQQVIGTHFQERGVPFDIEKRSSDPGYKARTISTNSRFKTVSGEHNFLIDPRCEHMIKDYEGVTIKEGTSGEPDKGKKVNKMLSHLSDSMAYYLEFEHNPEEDLNHEHHSA